MKQDALPNNFNKVNDTVGIRIPNHIIALEILRGFGKPVVATSANISGQSPNIDFAEAKRTIGAKLDHLVDGGLSKVGVGSTVVDYTDENDPKILREGSIEVL
jgi:L-threonylcarbamoyladenylate synthase